MSSISGEEKISIITTGLLVGAPTLTLLLVTLSHRPSPYFVWLALSVSILFAALLIRKKSKPVIGSDARILSGAFTIQLAITIALFSAYHALPDVDPYHWVKIYTQTFHQNSITALPQRPLFHTLIYLFNVTLHLSPEHIFKFIIPLLSLSILMPSWLVASRLPTRRQKWLMMLYPSLSSSLIISTQMGTPQAILNIVTSYSTCFLLYAHMAKKKNWHYGAGLLLAIATLYHGLATLLFSIWLIATLWHTRYRWLLSVCLVVLITISLPYAKSYLPQAFNDLRPNVFFPGSFTTIDGVPNGWPGFWGAAQYYGFYAGPTTLGIIALAGYTLLRHKNYRNMLRKLLASAPTLTLLLMGMAFFTIAELLPRLFNIAILPERAWLFVTLASPILILSLLQHQAKHSANMLGTILYALIALNIAGALYVNNLKQHLIPDYTINSARWISDALPSSALILSDKGPDYIDLYVDQTISGLPENFYCQLRAELPPDIDVARQPTYLYFYQEDEFNPYQNRPWKEKDTSPSCAPEKDPNISNYFLEQVYNDNDQAIIWQVL